MIGQARLGKYIRYWPCEGVYTTSWLREVDCGAYEGITGRLLVLFAPRPSSRLLLHRPLEVTLLTLVWCPPPHRLL